MIFRPALQVAQVVVGQFQDKKLVKYIVARHSVGCLSRVPFT